MWRQTDGTHEATKRKARHLTDARGGRTVARKLLPLLACAAVLAATGLLYVVPRLSRPLWRAVEREDAMAASDYADDAGEALEGNAHDALRSKGQRTAPAQEEEGLPSGWVKDAKGVRRYFDPETHEPRTGWVELGGNRYFCGANDGAAAVGWHEIDGATYRFDARGVMLTGWAVGEDGRSRWLKPVDGTMATHEWVEIGDLWQPFDDDGAWVCSEGEVIPPDDARNVQDMSMRQQAVVDSCDTTPWPGKGLCAAWVSSVFVNAGEPAVEGDACDIAQAWCVSSDLSELKPGMVVAVPSHSRTENGKIWGHVCIYVGKGIVRDSGTYGIRRSSLGSWIAWFGTDATPMWGWVNGIDLS